jgi:hypothetical protein
MAEEYTTWADVTPHLTGISGLEILNGIWVISMIPCDVFKYIPKMARMIINKFYLVSGILLIKVLYLHFLMIKWFRKKTIYLIQGGNFVYRDGVL